MADYGMESRSTEHRCQCCGEIAENVFCEDCMEHVSAGVEHADPGVTAPVEGKPDPQDGRSVGHGT
jgi:hypothetical protein